MLELQTRACPPAQNPFLTLFSCLPPSIVLGFLPPAIVTNKSTFHLTWKILVPVRWEHGENSLPVNSKGSTMAESATAQSCSTMSRMNKATYAYFQITTLLHRRANPDTLSPIGQTVCNSWFYSSPENAEKECWMNEPSSGFGVYQLYVFILYREHSWPSKGS